jgi:HAD superfamily hydrolase (TIGR01549 family)
MFKAFLFDLDGTVWNSKIATIEALAEVIAVEKGKRINKKVLQDLITLDTHREVLRLYGIYHDEIFWKEYRKRYDLVVLFFSDTRSILQEIVNRNRKLGVVTSLKKIIAMDLLTKFNLLSQFSVIITPSDTSARKPSSKPILMAINKLGLTETEAIYIGDKESDIIAAKNAGCYSGLAEWGNSAKLSISPDYRLKRLHDLINLCDR